MKKTGFPSLREGWRRVSARVGAAGGESRARLLALCCAVPVAASAGIGAGMGLTAAAVLTAAGALTGLPRRTLSRQTRVMAGIAVTACLAAPLGTLAGRLIPAFSEIWTAALPLTAVSCVILTRAEAFAPGRRPGRAALDGLLQGAGFALALIALGAVRELLGAGTLWGYPVFGARYAGAAFFLLPPGGFLMLALAAAASAAWKNRRSGRRTEEEARI